MNFTYEGPNASGSFAWNGSLTIGEVAGLPLTLLPLGLVPFGAVEAGGFVPHVDALALRETGGPPEGSAPLNWTGTATVSGPGSPAVVWSSSSGAYSDLARASFRLPSAGTYEIDLTATDSFGDVAYAPHSVTVLTPLTFTGGPSTLGGPAPLRVTFEANASGGTGGPYDYLWRLGNVTELTGSIAAYTFSTPGRYFVELVVSDRIGTSAYANWTIEVSSSSSSGVQIAGIPFGVVLLGIGAAVGAGTAIGATRRRNGPAGPTP